MSTIHFSFRAIVTAGVGGAIALGVATAAPAAASTDSTNPGGGSGHHFSWNGGVGDPSKSWGLVTGTLIQRVVGGPTPAPPLGPLPPWVIWVGGGNTVPGAPGGPGNGGNGGSGSLIWGCGSSPGC